MATFIALRALNHSAKVRVPGVLEIPAPTTLARTTNAATSTLTTGTYYYKVTAIGTTGETTGSNEVNAVVTSPVSEVQSLVVDATSGQYKLTFSAQTTSDIAFGALAATVQTALEGLSSIGVGNVAVSGGVGNSGGTNPYTITFQGTLANTNVAQITTSAGTTPLAGGAATATVTTSTQGSPGTTVALTWAAAPNAVSYRVYRGTSAGAENHYFAAATNAYTDAGGTGTAGTVPTTNSAEKVGGWIALTPTVDTVVDLDQIDTRRALGRHRAIGQYIVTGVNNSTATAGTLPPDA